MEGKIPIIQIEKAVNEEGESIVRVYNGKFHEFSAIANTEGGNVRIGEVFSDGSFRRGLQIETKNPEETLNEVMYGIIRDYYFFVSRFNKKAGEHNDLMRRWPRAKLYDIVLSPSF